ncbi:MAG: mechanosensitive ion channel family protein [Candidatus Delongbacteria bacterium]|nr:mechanosensitive ion channel family protein [Candidatus Delongbacteria bacterium]MCG2761425.1 mechanosensitive ion channel family protein [Candidatus Delongbacteria bacterium]
MERFLSQEYWLGITNQLIDWVIKEIPVLFLIILLFVVMLKIEKYLVDKLKIILLHRVNNYETVLKNEAEKRIITLMGIVRRLGNLLIWLVFIMILLRKLGIDIAPILAGAGIIGLAVGFGAQELVRDFISGFFMLLEDQIRRGDYAIINGVGGMVEKIELRTITLRDMTGTVHIFQNGKIDTLSNMTKEWSAIVLEIGVAYKEDVDQVMQIMKEVGEELATDKELKDLIMEPIEILGLDKFADSSIIIKARIKTVPLSQWAIGREYRRRLKYAFDEKNIEIPFPHTTVYWGEAIKPLDLNIKKQA